LDYLRATFAPTADATYDQLFALMREAEMLVVITANPEGLRATDARIRSRLSDVRLVTTLNLEQAHDYRLHYTAREEQGGSGHLEPFVY
jgi:hypothetical protein